MPKVRGIRRPLSVPRRWITEVMHASRGVPIITFERRMDLSTVAAVRHGVPWSVLFAKAFGLVARQRSELRRVFVRWPWPHLFECDRTRLSLAIERDYAGESAVLFAIFDDPASQSLAQLQEHVARWKTDPVERVSDFRKMIQAATLPQPLRRLAWWYAGCTGRQRAKNFGTAGISTTAGSGATALNLIAPVTTTLNWSPFDDGYRLDVRLHFDHRVLDGMTAAQTLAEVDNALNEAIVDELKRGV